MSGDGVKIGIILDVVFALILACIIILGVRKGLVKMIRGLLTTILITVISIFAVVPVTNLLTNAVNWDEKLATSIAPKVIDIVKFEEPYTTLTYGSYTDEDGNQIMGVVYISVEGNRINFDQLLLDTTLIQQFALRSIIKPNAEKYLTPTAEEAAEEQAVEGAKSIYLIDSLNSALAVYIMIAIVGVILFIVSYIIIRILFSFFQKASNKLYLVHFINKILGGIFGAVVGVVVLYVIVTIMLLLQNVAFMETINVGVESSYLTKYLFQFDALYNFIKDFSIADLINKMIGNNLTNMF